MSCRRIAMGGLEPAEDRRSDTSYACFVRCRSACDDHRDLTTSRRRLTVRGYVQIRCGFVGVHGNEKYIE